MSDALIVYGFFGLLILAALVVLAWDLRCARGRRLRIKPCLVVGAMVLVAVLGGVSAALYGAESMVSFGVRSAEPVAVLSAIVGTVCIFTPKARRVGALLLIVPLAGWGAFLAAGYGEDDRSQAWLRRHEAIVGNLLGEIKGALLAFRQAHGRFPTNDEGLAVLPEFASSFTFGVYLDAGAGPDEIPSLPTWFGRQLWSDPRDVLSRYKASHGSPKNEEELLAALDLYRPAEDPADSVRYETKVAITSRPSVFPLRKGQVLSPWWMPYVYENRRGLPAEGFAGSPADTDTARRYSVKVGEYVYVSSIGGQVNADALDRLWWADAGWRAFGGCLVLLAAVLVVLLRSSKGKVALGTVALLLSSSAGVGLHKLSWVTCYLMMPMFSYRSPEMVARREALLRKHRDTGVIGRETYEKALAAMRLTGDRPTTAPGETRNDPGDSASD